MKKQSYILVLITILLLLTPVSAITNNEVPTTAIVTDLIVDGGSELTAMDIGDVTAWNEGGFLYVQYMVVAPWCISETHLHVAETLEMIPQTKRGNPIPGHFSHKGVYDCIQMVTIMMPHTHDLCSELMIAAHAEVDNTLNLTIEPNVMTETAWAVGEGFPGNNWATYFTYLVQEPEICNDGIDNDCDGLTDGDDDDCGVACPITATEWEAIATVLETFDANAECASKYADSFWIGCFSEPNPPYYDIPIYWHAHDGSGDGTHGVFQMLFDNNWITFEVWNWKRVDDWYPSQCVNLPYYTGGVDDAFIPISNIDEYYACVDELLQSEFWSKWCQ